MNHYHVCHYGPLPFYQRSTVFVSPMIMEKKTNDFGEGNGFSSHLQRDCTWTDQCRKVLWDRTCGFSSSSEKTRKSNRSQMSLQRQHFLLIYLKILSVGPAGVWTRDLPLRGPALYQLTELTRRRLINQDWSNIQSKNYGDSSLMSQECTGGIMLVPRERHKMKWKTDKTIDHQRHFVNFLWTSNRGQQVYDMRIVQLDFEEKTQFF